MLNLQTLEILAKTEIQDALEAYEKLANSPEIIQDLTSLATSCSNALKAGSAVFFAGNGGSFADAQHMAAELTGKMSRMRKPLAGIVLGANSSSMSAIGNDFGFDQVFSRELEALHQPNSVVIGFTTSGDSKNLLSLAITSKSLGLEMFCFTGQQPGRVDEHCKTIKAPSARTERIQ